jgi:hypothetical protein
MFVSSRILGLEANEHSLDFLKFGAKMHLRGKNQRVFRDTQGGMLLNVEEAQEKDRILRKEFLPNLSFSLS